MSVICLQYGQCGNQVGNELYKTICQDIGTPGYTPSDYTQELDDKWFFRNGSGSRKARSVLIDSEDKVTSNLNFSNKYNWSYDNNFVATVGGGGSGNNWAMGYYENGLELVDKILDLIDHAAESIDCGPDVLLSIQSLGGGTGSGLSCFIGQALRDQYPKVTRTSISILPSCDGDVCTQPYNTLLSLSKLYDSQDAIILLSNDYIYKMCTQVLKIKSVSLRDMNCMISEQVACSCSIGKLSELIDHLTKHPSFKIISMRSSPHVPNAHTVFEPTPSWASLVGQLKMSLVKSDVIYDFRPFSRTISSVRQRSYKYYKCVSNLLICRGPNCSEVELPVHQHPFNDSCLYPQWFPHPPQFMFGSNNKKFIDKDRFISLMTNCGFPQALLEPVIKRALTLFSHEAYLHHYIKYGLSKKEFLNSIECLENIVKTYDTLN